MWNVFLSVLVRRESPSRENFGKCFKKWYWCGSCGFYSGVEFNLKGLLTEEGQDEESVMSSVFTPIFFSDDSSVTEMERV